MLFGGGGVRPYVREMLEHMDEHLIKHRKITTRKVRRPRGRWCLMQMPGARVIFALYQHGNKIYVTIAGAVARLV